MASRRPFNESDALLALTSSSLGKFSIGEMEKATNNFDKHSVFFRDLDFTQTKYVANISNSDTTRKSDESTLAFVNCYLLTSQFMNEVRTSTKIQVHKNLISLIGYCIDSYDRLLVYEYMKNGRLDNYLDKVTYRVCRWKKRLKICLQVAYALQHLHQSTTEFPNGMPHGSVNSTNILFDETWDAKLSDFTLSEHSNISSIAKDVFNFGTLLIDVLCWDNQCYKMLERKYGVNDLEGLVEKGITLVASDAGDELSPDSLKTFSHVIRKCVESDKLKRPTIDEVVLDLEVALKFQELIDPQPIFTTTLDLLNSSSSSGSESRPSESDLPDDFNSSSSSSLNVSSSFSSLRLLDSCQQFPLDKIRIATNNFDIEKRLGKGGEATVYRGEIYLHSKTEKSIVAVKHLEKGIGSEEFENEITTVPKFRHPNIVSLLGYCKESDEKVLIYEYMGKGSLSDYVKSDSKVHLSWKRRLNICLDAAKGFQFLHKKTKEFPTGIIHRDVKPENILIDDNWIAKVSDFGMLKLSKVNQTSSIMSTLNMKGTPGYFAPEYVYFKKVSKKIDVYAFGFVMFEVLCRKKRWELVVDKSIYPKDGDEIVHLIRENIDSTIKHEIADGSLQVFIAIIAECMQFDPDKRPTMDQLVLKLEEALKI